MRPMDCVMASPTAALQQRSPVRFQFDGLAGDEVSVTAAPTCTRSDIAEWGLEDPDGFRVTLRTPACKDLTAETLTKDGRWAVVIFNRNAADVIFRYEFTIGRQKHPIVRLP
jgi:hypothetical protein